MATTHQDTNVNQLVINKLTKQEYNNLSQVSDTELYLVEEQVDSTVTQGSTNPVQSGAVYEALQDIGGNINDGTTIFAKNQEIIGTTSANQSVNQTIKLPNDVVMCKILENRALASYATPITRFKYIEDHGWVDMDRSDIQYNEGTGEWTGTFVSLDITEGDYYYDIDNEAVFVADENSEMQDVSSTVIIQGDINKLYCDVDDNKLYRYDGTNFVSLTSEGKTYTLSSNNENIRLTDSDGQTQDLSLSTLINGLSTGSSDPQDDDYIVAQYAGGGTTTTTYHRRPLSKFWNWIKTKLGIGTNDGTFLRKDGTWVTPTDTKATVTTTGSGNAITSLTASNGALTATKGSTFLSGTVAIANGGTGATTRLGALQNLTRESVGTSAQFFLTITTDWGKGGYTSVADAKTVLGLGSAAYVNADTAASNNTVVKRTSNGYINATYFNQSSSAETPTSSSYIMYCNSDGYLRKSSIANIKSLVNTNTWRPLGTGASDACAGNDSRLSNSRPASDVYAWAKASTKPSYTASEVGAISKTISTFSGTGYSAVQIGPNSNGIVIIDFAYKPTSSSVSLSVSGQYQKIFHFLAGNRSTVTSDTTAVFRLTAGGYIQNESSISTDTTYYGQVIAIRVA